MESLPVPLAELPLFDALPYFLQQPPGLWGLLLALGIFFLWLVRRMLRALAGGDRSALRDAKLLLKQGNEQEAGRTFEALGKYQKALGIYRKAGLHEDRALLLLRLDRRKEAKAVASEGGEWRLYGELCQEDGDLGEASVAYERAGRPFLAAQGYAELGRPVEAARCYLAAGMESEALKVLGDAEGPEAAELTDRAVRSSLHQMGGSGLSLEVQGAVQHGVQLWLAEGDAERAFRLAVDTERFELAVPVARDYLEPSREGAEVCVRAGAHPVAAQIYERLGDGREAALQRAEAALRRGNSREAAEHFEAAGEWAEAADQWAASGNTTRAAELFTRAGDNVSAARLTGPDAGISGTMVTVPAFQALSDGPRTVPAGRPTPVGPVASREDVPARDLSIPEVSTSDFDRDRYRILEELGRGGMGVVYRAEDPVLQREVAYKMVPEVVLGVEVEAESLLAEARAAARLSHPNIVQVYDAGRRGNDGFFVIMELVHGINLEKLLEERRITLAGVLRTGLQICAALDHAHGRRVIHRDLKPSNLMWSDDNRLKLTDFGLARAFEASTGQVVTQPAGTPTYMAPEQIRGEPVSVAVDLYALGCVLFELLTRESVFGNGPPSFHHHLSTRPRDPRELATDALPDALANLVLQCLSKEPADRPASAAAVGKALSGILQALDGTAADAGTRGRS